MSELESFSYERFMSLSGSSLVSYAEPFVNTRTHAIPESVFDLLMSNLTRLDEAHTIYALEICMALKPSEFISVVVGFLANANASISCTAYRLLSKTPPELISADLRSRIAATPVVDLFTSDVRTGTRIRIGTNEEFIRDLVANFSASPNCTF